MRSQLSGLRARRAVLSNQIATSQTALNTTEGLTPTFTSLQRKVDELDSNYQAFLKKRDEAEIAHSMDRQDLVNFAVVEAPSYSLAPGAREALPRYLYQADYRVPVGRHRSLPHGVGARHCRRCRGVGALVALSGAGYGALDPSA